MDIIVSPYRKKGSALTSQAKKHKLSTVRIRIRPDNRGNKKEFIMDRKH